MRSHQLDSILAIAPESTLSVCKLLACMSPLLHLSSWFQQYSIIWTSRSLLLASYGLLLSLRSRLLIDFALMFSMSRRTFALDTLGVPTERSTTHTRHLLDVFSEPLVMSAILLFKLCDAAIVVKSCDCCCVTAGYSSRLVSTAIDLSALIVAYNFMTPLLNVHIATPSLCELLALLAPPLLVVLSLAASFSELLTAATSVRQYR